MLFFVQTTSGVYIVLISEMYLLNFMLRISIAELDLSFNRLCPIYQFYFIFL